MKIIAMASVLLLSVEARSDEPAVSSGWSCNFCTYAAGWFGSLDIGPGYASDTSLKFADYRGIDDEGAFISVYGDIHYRNNDEAYFDLYARDLGTDARQLEMRGGRRGRFEIRFAYAGIPKYRGFGTQTPFRGAGSSNLVLPASWVKAPSTGGMSALTASLNPVSLQTLRKVFDAGLSFKSSSKWRYQLDVNHTEKNGTRPFGAGVFTIQSSQFPAPVDFTTNRLDLGVEYSSERAHVRLGFSSSWFNNGQSSITWENPFSPIGNTMLLRAALEPDNDFHQFSLTGSFKPSPKVRLSGRAAIGRARQDDAFLPYSINPDFGDLVLPRASLNGKIDTSTLNLATRLTARLTRKLSLNARIKIDERDNRNPLTFYTPVITDLVPRPQTANRPYSFKRMQYSVDVNYRAHPSMRLRAGIGRKDHQRTLQSVRETEESTWWGELNFTHWATAQLRLRLESSQRDITPYQTVNDPGLQENLLLRKFNLAKRDRHRAVIELDLSPPGRLSASLSYFVSEDDYEQSVLGLLDSEERSLNVDLGFTISRNLSLHAFISRDDFDSEISGAISAISAPWSTTTRDRFTTFGASLNGKLSDRLEIGVDYVSSDATGRIATDSGAGEAPFPALETELRNARLSLSYRVNPQWRWTLFAELENYRSKDWQIDGLGNDGISAILTLGTQSPDYNVTLLRLLANYSF